MGLNPGVKCYNTIAWREGSIFEYIQCDVLSKTMSKIFTCQAHPTSGVK